VYSSVPRVNRGDTPESGWIHLKVDIQVVLLLVGKQPNSGFTFPALSQLSKGSI